MKHRCSAGDCSFAWKFLNFHWGSQQCQCQSDVLIVCLIALQHLLCLLNHEVVLIAPEHLLTSDCVSLTSLDPVAGETVTQAVNQKCFFFYIYPQFLPLQETADVLRIILSLTC